MHLLLICLGLVTIFVNNGHSTTFIKVDCYPEPGATQQACQNRGCTWQVNQVRNAPFCYFTAGKNMAGYNVRPGSLSSVQNSNMSAILDRRNTSILMGNPALKLQLMVKYKSPTRLRLHLFNPLWKKDGEKTTMEYFRETLPENSDQPSPVKNREYTVSITQNPFGITVTRNKTGQVIFDTRNIAGLTFEEQYISLTTRTVQNVYGFGEQTHPHLKHDMNWHKWPMFSRDQPRMSHEFYDIVLQLTGVSGMNLYGVHPFFMGVEPDGRAYGVVLYNAHAQSVELAPYPSISYKTIGGDLDFEIFLGSNPDEVVMQYVTSIGLPELPPYWSLGFHLCRYGYKSLNDLKTTVDRNQKAGIPQDVQWIDIDYMDKMRDFTYDPSKWAGLPAFARDLQAKNMKFVPILVGYLTGHVGNITFLSFEDPCIASKASNYRALDEGVRQKAFIADPNNPNQFLEAEVWPGNTYFPDFTSKNGTCYWKQMIKEWNNSVPLNGLWIDMNEPSSFVTGSTKGCTHNKYNNPPFVPLPYTNILDKTICMDAMQSWGRHYDVHSLFGYSQAIATNQALRQLAPGIRPFLLSRSTYVGSGHYTAHWTGDNTAVWSSDNNQLLFSIITILEFQMFGVPFTGADICGFNGAAQEEMCVRWMQLGAFYPFMRNHNSINQPPQDPAHWNNPAKTYMRNALKLRYKLLPHFYTVFQMSHKTGAPVVRPLFFQYASDSHTLGIDDQFLWSDSLMVVPVITQSTTQRNAYFPKDRWFNFFNGAEVSGSETGRTHTVSIPLSTIGLFLRGGSIVPWQSPAMNTHESRQNPFGLTIALDANQMANGSLYLDDGVTFDADIKNIFSVLQFVVNPSINRHSSILSISRPFIGYNGADSLNIFSIQVFGILSEPQKVNVLGQTLSSGVAYDSQNQALSITGLSLPVHSSKSATQVIEWFY